MDGLLDLDRWQGVLHKWRGVNFPGADATQQLLGVVEEVGELSHSHLKQQQGIRGTDEEHEEAAKDAVGDVMIYLAGYCSCRGWSLAEVMKDTTHQVLERDWIEFPYDGGQK